MGKSKSSWFFRLFSRSCLTCCAEQKRRLWLLELLSTGGWRPISPEATSRATLQKQAAHYKQIESSEAWKDFMFRLTQLRDGTRLAIERGVVDAHGKTHGREQRAVLYILEQLLQYVPGIHRDYEQMVAALQQDESLANAPVYGQDVMANHLTSDY